MRERISRLSAAPLRVSASLDLETVLREVVDAARDLTGARYGSITTIDDAGEPENFITAGFPPEVHQRIADWAVGARLFPHFRDLPGPLRRARADREALVDTSPVGGAIQRRGAMRRGSVEGGEHSQASVAQRHADRVRVGTATGRRVSLHSTRRPADRVASTTTSSPTPGLCAAAPQAVQRYVTRV